MPYQVEIGGRARQVTASRVADRLLVSVDGLRHEVDAVRVDAETWSLRLATGGHKAAAASAVDLSRCGSFEVTVTRDPATSHLTVYVGTTPVAVRVNGRRLSLGRRDEGGHAGVGPQHVVAPMPGKIVRVLVQVGEVVRARQPLIVVEAMKMENELRAERDGTVAGLHVGEGVSVEPGTLLVVIE